MAADALDLVNGSGPGGRIATEILYSYLEDRSRIVKTFSMQALADLAIQDPELRGSIVERLEELTRTGSPAMKSRGKKLLARLARPQGGRRRSRANASKRAGQICIHML